MKKIAIFSAVAFLPILAFAASLTDTMTTIQTLLEKAVPLMLSIIFVWFVWGIGKYVVSAKDDKTKEEARNIIIYAVIVFSVIFGIWGLVKIVTGTFDIEQEAPKVKLPKP